MSYKARNIGLIFLILTFCLGLLSTSYAEAKFKFEFDIDVGFDGYVKQGEPTPVRIEIKNNYKDIEGKIELLVHEKRDQKDLYTAYSKKINIAKDATKIINMESIFYRNGLLYVRIVDKNDNVVFKKMVKYLQMNRPDGMLMGIFSEDVDRLRYLSKIENMNYTSGNRAFFQIAELDETIPENYKTLQVFQTIVINNYDSEKLNAKQRQALKEWVEAGGVLLVGTGPNHQKTLKGLEDINFLEVQGTKEINVDKIDSEKPLKLINAALNDGEEIYIEGNEELKLYHNKLGKGHVVITGFDMELSPFAKWDGKDKFIGQVINKYLDSDADNYIQNYPKSRSHWFNNIVNYLPYNLLPSMSSILIILILFILLVGPVNYFVLKKIDRRELLWITIPIIVVLFSASIYILGFKTRLRQPIANNVSIVKIDNETKSALISTKSGLMGFKNGAWDVAFDRGSEIVLEERRDYDVLQRFADEEVVTEYSFDKEKHVIFNKAGVLDVETININSKKELNDKIVSDIVIKDGKLVGSVNNVSGLNLEDMVIFYGSKYKKIGSFEEGEDSKEFEVNIGNNNTISNWYGIIDSLYGHRGQRSKNNTDQEDILNDNIKRDILEGLMDLKYSVINKERFFMIAWNKDQIMDTIKINGKKAKSIDRNIVLIPLSIKYEEGQRVNIPYGILFPEIEENHNMHIEQNGSVLYGEGYVVFRFNPQEDMKLSSMEIDINASQNKSIYEVYIFNFTKNEWEKWDKADMIIDASNIDKYYSSDRGTLVKIDPIKDTDIFIPSFKVEGDIK